MDLTSILLSVLSLLSHLTGSLGINTFNGLFREVGEGVLSLYLCFLFTFPPLQKRRDLSFLWVVRLSLPPPFPVESPRRHWFASCRPSLGLCKGSERSLRVRVRKRGRPLLSPSDEGEGHETFQIQVNPECLELPSPSPPLVSAVGTSLCRTL